MILELVEEIIAEDVPKRLTKEEWDAVKVLNKYFDDKRKVMNWGQPFAWITDVDGIQVEIAREGLPSGFHWRLWLTAMGGSDARHEMDCIMLQGGKVVEKALKEFFKWVKDNKDIIEELIAEKETIKLEDLVAEETSRLRRKYCKEGVLKY